jgi:hypothetical protein
VFKHWRAVLACLWYSIASGACAATSVTVDSAVIAGAESRPAVAIDITEFRDGTSNVARLLAGTKHYAISVVSHEPITALEAQLSQSAAIKQFTVVTESGRTYVGCLLAGLSSEGSGPGYRYVYAMRCADVN